MNETIEEAALKWFVTTNKREIIFDLGWIKIFEAGAKWQKERSYTENQMDDAYDKGFKDAFERMYTEEEVITLLEKRDDELDYWYVHKRNNYPHLTDWFEEYKKK